MKKLYSYIVGLLLALHAEAVVAEAPWIIREDGNERIERSVSETGEARTFFFKGKVLIALLSSKPYDGVDEGSRLVFPYLNTELNFISHCTGEEDVRTLVQKGGKKTEVRLGSAFRIAPGIELTKYGFVSMWGRYFITHSGHVITVSTPADLLGKGLVQIIDPFGKNDWIEASDDVVALGERTWGALNKTLALSLPSTVVVQSNKSLEKERTVISGATGKVNPDDFGEADSGSMSSAAGNSVCEPLPRCCCEEHERAGDGECYKPRVLATGMFGIDATTAKITGKLSQHPCEKNTFVWEPEMGACIEDLAKDLADFVRLVERACRFGPMHIDAYCWSGNVVGQAMDQLNPGGRYTIDAYTVGWSGTFAIWRTLDIFHISDIFLSGPAKDLMRCRVPRPQPVPSHVTSFRNFIGTGDHNFPDASQASGPRGSTNIETEGDHYSTITDNIRYRTCCGDTRFDAPLGEECDPPGTYCIARELGPHGNHGVCRDNCRCAPQRCGDGVVSPETGEQCDPPGSMVDVVGVPQPDGGCAMVALICTDDCKIPPSPSSTCLVPTPTPTPTPTVSGTVTPTPTATPVVTPV